MLRFGKISQLGEGENIGFARVYFDDRDFVSGWLPLPSTNTKANKQWIPIEVNSQVACLMDEYCEQGVIIAVLWSATDQPPKWANKDTIGIQFADGSEIFYSVENKALQVNAPEAEINIKCNKLNVEGEVNIIGNTNVEGEIIATEEVTAGELKIKLTKHKHTTPMGVSGVPLP